MTAPLSVQDLVKEYRTPGKEPFPAVQGITFEIQERECFGLLGPNGAGKSTSMHCISGFYPVTSGHIRIFEFDVHTNPQKARMCMGICAQEDTLDTDFTVLDQMIRYGTYFRVPVDEGRRRSLELLDRFGLLEKQHDLVEQLSGGMRRRLQVARSLVSLPKVWILDEPTTGLDPEVRRVVWDVLSEQRTKGTAILLSTHYMEEAQRLCDRVAILSHGKILDCGSPSDLIVKHMGPGEIEEEIRKGVFWKRPPNLEDVYLRLTGSRLENGE